MTKPRPKLLSGDPPGHPLVSALLVLLLLALLGAPFLFPGTRPLATASRICIFVVLAASFDILLGYTGIVSFAHTMFFAIGAYAVAIPLAAGYAGWPTIALGILAGAAAAAALSAAIALLSLRVQKIFFAMVTLAVASFAQILVTQLRSLTGGEDGLTFSLPHLLSPAFTIPPGRLWGVRLDGHLLTYYLTFSACLLLFLLMLRIVNSPFGRVLQAIRENEFRAEAIGFRVVAYRTAASALAAAIAAIAGTLFALTLRYVGPDATLSFSLMVDLLLMVVIGGMGTLYGAALGAVVVVLAQNYLQALLQSASDATAGLPLLPVLLHPDRWLLWLGLLFVLFVYFLPQGVMGTFRRRAAQPTLPPPP